jgi:predicted transposase YdaD
MEGEEQNDDYDSPWKDAITRYLPEFMAFYFPDAHAEIDWSRPHRFLDQELAQVVRDWDRQRIIDLFAVVDWLLRLPRELEEKLWGAVMELEQERNMPYVTSVERIGLRRGRKEGLQEGRKEGRQEGEATVLLRLIELKFGSPDAASRNRVESADAETLLRWSERILTAGSLEELFA